MKTRYSVLMIIAIFSFISGLAQISLPVRQLDKNLLVGATAGYANVNGNGAATYSVPIFVSPGTAGLQPNISIEYNSQVSNGVLGVGWNIAGLSAITRVPQDYYHDGIVKGVSLTYNDKYEWDGNRITGITGGSSGTVYVTESENFAYILSPNQQAGYGPASFSIKTKEGTVLSYGETTDSRIEAPGSATVLMWRLNKMSDINGNYINYYYTEINGESYIDRIEYTGNSTTGLLPYNIIQFTYENRSDKSMFYVGGLSITQTKRLTGIEIKSDNVTIRQYSFNYLPIARKDAGYEKSRLAQIQETGIFNGVSKALNPTIFNWPLGMGASPVNSTSNTLTTETTRSFFGDLNGDGRTDQLILGKTSGSTYFARWYYYQSNGTTLTKISSGNLDIANCTGATIIDINNDGKSEILLTTTSPAMNYSIINGSLVRGSSLYDVNLPNENAKILTGQINSDGKIDLIILGQDNNFSNGYEKGISISVYPGFNTPDKVELMDFDGDGLDEVFVLKAEAYTLYKYNETNSTFMPMISGSFSEATVENLKTGDFNGDGKKDIVLHNANGNKFSVYLSTGIAFTGPVNTATNLILDDPKSNSEADFAVLDLNGDGRDDVLNLFIKLNVVPATLLTPHCNDCELPLNGSPGFVRYYSAFDGTLGMYRYDKLSDGLTNQSFQIDFGDIDGDGMQDAAMMLNPSQWMVTAAFNGSLYKNFANLYKYRVETIVNGMNQAAGFEYLSLAAANSTKYTKGTSSAFPLIDIQPAQFVVAKLTTHAGYMNNGTYVYSVTDYSYKGARSHMQGRGYLGFDTFISENNLSNVKTESSYSVDGTFFIRYPLSVNTSVAGVLSDLKTFTFVTQSLGSKRFYSYPSKDISNNLVTSTTVTHDYTFDTYGNRLTDKATFGTDAVITTTNTYIAKPSSCVPNRVSTSIVSSVYTGQPAFAIKKSFTYDTKGNCLTTVDFADQAKPITTTYTYTTSSCGLPLSVSVSASGMTARTSSTVYDSKYRMPISTTNPAGYVSEKTYNYGTGVTLTEKAPNGLITSYNYDELGRLINATVPKGYTIIQSLTWSASGDPAGTIFSKTTTIPGKPTLKAYYDILGREIRTESGGFNNKTLFTDINYLPASPYGKAGMLTSQTFPYYTGETPIPVSYKYDAYGRVTEVNDRSMINQTSYSGKTVTSTDVAGRGSSKTVNALGNVVSATDNGGNITYLYHSSGQPRQINAVSAVSTITYDPYGRQSSLADPDACTTTYTYNGFGELASQTDANSKTYNMLYDNLGRLLQKSIGSEITTYTYNATGSGIGQVASVTAPNGSKQEFGYDSFGRPINVIQTIPGQATPFTTTYTFDIYDNNTQITYPETGYAVTNTFDMGRLVKVSRTSDNSIIWELKDVSSHGMPLSTTFGTSINTTYGYDMDQLTQITTGSVQNDTYTVDHPNLGNLLSRKDNTTGKYESFFYDNLDRLTKIASLAGSSQTIDYSGNGNIISKSNGGTYAYDPTKLHAVTSVTKTAGTSPQTLQDITYTSFNKAATIQQRDPVTNLPLSYAITYGPDEQRVKTVYTDVANAVTTKYYAGSYEKEIKGTTTRQIHYIIGGTGLVAVFIRSTTGTVVDDKLYYVCKDRQGSITALLNINGTVAEKYSYDAWGRRRNPANWSDYNVTTPSLISRGYTGHEMLDGFGLINMNGRMYDPVIGRVLSPDDFVQSPGYTQSYNRYSYCMNNPLKYTDPSGMLMCPIDFNNALFDMSGAWADRVNNPNSYLYTSGGGGGGGGGWGGIGGVVPGGNGDYGSFWQQLYSAANHALRYIPQNITFRLSQIGYSNGSFEFTFQYDSELTDYYNNKASGISKQNAIDRSMPGPGMSTTTPGDLPSTYDYKNGETFKSNDGCTYQLVNNEWVKLSGILVNAEVYSSISSLGYTPSIGVKPIMMDEAVMRAVAFQTLESAIDWRGFLGGYSIESLKLLKFAKLSPLTLGLGVIFNTYTGLYDQMIENQKHDNEVKKRR